MKSSVVALAVASLLIAGSAFASEKLAEEKKCTTCHKVDTKTVGPSFKQIAEKNPEPDIDKLAQFSITGGTSGKNYEGITMPMVKQDVTEDEAKAIVKWMLATAAE